MHVILNLVEFLNIWWNNWYDNFLFYEEPKVGKNLLKFSLLPRY